MPDYYYTAVSWAMFLGFTGAVGTYYFVAGQRKPKNQRAAAAKQTNKGPEARKDTKGKNAKKDGAQSSGDQDAKPSKKSQKKKVQKSGKSDQEDPAVTSPLPDSVEDDADNLLEFAQQMSSAKTGKFSAPKSEAASRPKAVKQSRAMEKPVAESSTGPSSTTGADADDDQSPINSPDLSATTIASPVTNGGVSDMLEKPSPGPSILKITPPTNPTQPKKPKPKTSENVPGKQHNKNVKKREAKTLQQEEEEKERQALLEKQRRTAREAEGRAPKDGRSFMATQAPSSSAWTNSSNTIKSNNTTTTNAQLLDTLEAPASKPTATEPKGSDLLQAYGSYTEEEQKEMLAADSDSEWNVVKPSKSKEKRKGPNKTDQKENKDPKDERRSSSGERSDSASAPVAVPTKSAKTHRFETSHYDNEHKIVKGQDLAAEDAEWDVS
jgi:hypothetical protein